MTQVDRLCAWLGEETQLCDALAAVLRDEQQAIVGLRPAELLACVERREALSRALLAARDARQLALSDLAGAYGIDSARPEGLLARLPGGPQALVRGALGRLREALTTGRSLERQTARLVEGSLAHVQELVRSLTALVPGARYGADAELEAPAATERLDRRA